MMGDYSLWSGVFIWKKTSKTHESGMKQIMRKSKLQVTIPAEPKFMTYAYMAINN